jgi:purine-cytosine permease-like protein
MTILIKLIAAAVGAVLAFLLIWLFIAAGVLIQDYFITHKKPKKDD